MTSPRLFTIPASAPFLPTLVRALVEGRLIPRFSQAGDPLALAAATLYLPTRRACRLARDVFLDVLEGEAAILPRIVPIGDVDEDEIAFAEAAAGGLASEALALPPALDGFARKLLLARLILRWAETTRPDRGAPLVANSPAAALALADDLARLLDDMTTRKVSWDKLDGLVPDEMDVYWQITLKFLGVMRDAWPAILAERNAIEPAERRDRLIAAEAARLQAHPGPVIAAGSTGSMPATAMLLATIARLPQGAVVLPGLDTDLDDDAWALIGGDEEVAPAIGHPQFAMQALIRRIGVARDAVETLGVPARHGREAFVSEALRPAATTQRWQQTLKEQPFAARTADALEDVAVIEAANAEEEALAVAVVLREAAEEPGKTAALVTPDRALARRVLAALGRWQVPVDDSGGDSLADNAAGVFARLAAEVPLRGFEPVTLLALLKHPLFRLGAPAGAHRADVSILERAILHGPRPRPGSAGLSHALATLRRERAGLHHSDPRKDLGEAQLDRAAAFVAKLAAAAAPLEDLERKNYPLAALCARHTAVVAALAAENGANVAFAGHDGTALAAAFEDMTTTEAAGGIAAAPGDYPELFRLLIASRVVRRPGMPGSRVRIYGPLEARLQPADRVVLGGLVEGTWPPEMQTDPWLSRPMRHELGLDLPERRIGLSAHDFAQSLGAPEVFLTRAAKVAGAPTVASRFLQRLGAVADGERWKAAHERGARYLAFARALDAAAPGKPLQRPEPKPPRAARPKALTVTEIEDWLRDPYTIYAKHVLKLTPLDAVDTPPGARDRGNVIHAAIGDFTKDFAAALPENSVEALLALGKKHFAPLEDYPEARAFWWPRFLRIAHWFAGWETERRAGVRTIQAEISGRHAIQHAGGTFELRARADRIEILSDGRIAIVDYKTGQAPTEKQVRLGLSPQLTLEAAILRSGGFREIAAGASVAELLYVRLRGGEPAGDPCLIEFKEGTPDSQADRALAKLTEIIAKFDDEATPYRSLVHPMWKNYYGVYDHLARVKEWSAGREEDEDE